MKTSLRIFVSLLLIPTLLQMAGPAAADNSWNGYHWARTTDLLTLQLGDNVTNQWDAYLAEASRDWNQSTVLTTSVVAGRAGNVKRCSPATGAIEVCSSKYGFNGWLGVAGIQLSGGHIVAGYVKLNDSYFNTASYNKPEWRRLVACQEVGHIFGLDHSDETFDNANQGTCMDYTNNPLGPPSNEHPNTHDLDQLAAIYSHSHATSGSAMSSVAGPGKSSRSRVADVDHHGNGVVTWTLWVE